MSSRVLKKLHGDNELEIREPDTSDLDNDNSFIGSSGARKKQFDNNRYDLVTIKINFQLQAASFVFVNFFPSFIFVGNPILRVIVYDTLSCYCCCYCFHCVIIYHAHKTIK